MNAHELPNPPSARDILRKRARALAVEPPRAAAAGPALQVIEFVLADERYALDMHCVSEIQPLERLTPLPCTPSFVAGIINVRGRILAVIDLKTFFNLPDKGITDLHRAVIVQHGDIELGLLADTVIGTRELRLTELQPPLLMQAGTRSVYVRGITAERLIVLDAAQILTDPKLIVDEAPKS